MSDEFSDDPPRPNLQPADSSLGPSFEGMPYTTLRRYVLGASDAVDQRRIEAWASSPARRAYLAALERAWRRTERENSDAQRKETDAAWAALLAQLEVPLESSPSFQASWEAPAVEIDVGRHQPARILTGAFARRRSWWMLPVAAAASLLVAGGAWLVHEKTGRAAVPEQPPEMREVATAAGQRAEVKLGDGSTIALGVKSRLRFPATLGRRSRELYLEGQAYFVVTHDSLRPFVVYTAGSKTVDLGTAFVLRAYPGDERVEVIVTEGNVSLASDRPGAPAALLAAGQIGQLAKADTVPVVRAADTSAYTGWVRGRLTFDNTPLPAVLAELNRWYDVEVRLADPLLARETFTASFAANSLSESLRTITTVLRLRAEQQGSVVLVHRRAR